MVNSYSTLFNLAQDKLACINQTRCHLGRWASAFALLAFSTASWSASLDGQTLGISYIGTDYGPLSDAVTVGTGHEISYGDGSDIGGLLMLDEEYIEISSDDFSTLIEFNLRGDGPAHPIPGYQSTGLNGSYVVNLGAGYVFDSLLSIGSSIIDINGMNIDDVNMPGISISFGNLYFDVSEIGILDNVLGPDVGKIQIHATIQEVPVPAALPLLLSGLGVLAFWSRKKHQG